MNDILKETIRLNILLEGSLRVALDRPTAEALETARQLYDRIGLNLAKLEPAAAPSQAETTIVKDDEAEGAEEEPLQEPNLAPSVHITADDLRRSLTLNDKFRFRRELFGSSDIEMNDTLQLIASMGSEEEAREYLLDDLQFDPEDPTVKDFLAVIEAAFNRK